MAGGISVPFNDLKKHHEEHVEDFHRSLDELLNSNAWVGGPGVGEFESDFASFCSVPHAVGTGNGTDAITAALKACGVGKGDLVVTVPNTFIATTEAITCSGAEVLFVDIEDESMLMDLERVSDVVSNHPEKDRIKAVLPVHLYGQPIDLQDLRSRVGENIAIVADSAQAHGATFDKRPIATDADLSTFSFYPGKNLGALGDGGAVVGKDEEKIEYIRSYCNHGRGHRHQHRMEGINSRLDTLQALFLKRKLESLTSKTLLRQKWAALYNLLLADIEEVRCPRIEKSRQSVFHLYVIRLDNRDEVADALAEKGIQTGLHYPVPLHLQEAYGYLGLREGDFPNTENAASKILTLPLYPEMDESQVHYVVDTLKEIFSKT